MVLNGSQPQDNSWSISFSAIENLNKKFQISLKSQDVKERVSKFLNGLRDFNENGKIDEFELNVYLHEPQGLLNFGQNQWLYDAIKKEGVTLTRSRIVNLIDSEKKRLEGNTYSLSPEENASRLQGLKSLKEQINTGLIDLETGLQWFHKITKLRDYENMQNNPQAYLGPANGIVTNQGRLGSCSLLAAFRAMSLNTKTAEILNNNVKQVGNVWEVNFPGLNEKIEVFQSDLNLNENYTKISFSNNPIDSAEQILAVMEIAYSKTQKFSSKVGTGKDKALSSSFCEVLSTLGFSKIYSSYEVNLGDFLSSWKSKDYIRRDKKEAFLNKIGNNPGKFIAIAASTFILDIYSPLSKVPLERLGVSQKETDSAHAFVVEGVDSLNKTVHLSNPWLSSHSQAIISYEEFLKYFHDLTIVEVPE